MEEVDPAVVVIDQASQLGRDDLADLSDVVQAIQLRGDALQHAQLGHRPKLSSGRQDGQRRHDNEQETSP